MSGQLTTGDVPHAIPASSVQSSVPKSTITKRNVKTKKGLGAKKVGLGGKKVTKIDFEKLEKNAEEADKVKHRLSVSSSTSDSNKGKNEETSGESLRLAYQDLTIKEKQNNIKLSKMDSSKKAQAQRLGMGMGRTDGVSHSLDMVTISQVDPVKPSRRGRYDDDEDTFYDAFSTSKARRHRWDDSDSEDDDSSLGKNDFSYMKKSGKDSAPPTYTIKPIGDGHRADTNILMSTTTAEPKSNRQRIVKNSNETSKGEIPEKYKNASGISSEMLFGTNRAEESDGERLRKFQGHSSISSDDYYGRDSTNKPNPRGIRDGVKEGVRSVAGKLSTMASDLATTIQDRYS